MRKPSPRGTAKEAGKEVVKEAPKEEPTKNEPTKEADAEAHHPGVLERISHIHKPTKDAMLAAANSAWQRLRIRTKWSLIRQMRPYNLEDIGAFFSWLFLGHVIWIVVGTTTFMSLAIFLVNSVFAQGMRSLGGLRIERDIR